MRKFYSSCVALGLSVTAVVFLNSSSSLAQGQGGALWQPSGQNAAYTMRSIGIKTSSPLYDADVNGSLHSRTAVVDSILSCWEVMVSDILTVGNKLIVGGKISAAGISVTGLAESGSILTGNIISTNVNADSLSANHISATGFSTVSINSQNYYYNGNLINIPQIQTDIQNGKTRITALETTTAVHDSLLSNITSSQWQNNDTNIYFNSGKVGIGTTEPSEMLEINGRVKITGTATEPDTSVTPPSPAQGKSIIIDGGIDRITATSGTLDFANTNLTTTGNIQSTSITTSSIIITDNFSAPRGDFDTLNVNTKFAAAQMIESDTMHALKSIEVNNSLKIQREDANDFAEVSTKDTMVALVLQREEGGELVIGNRDGQPGISPSPGNTRDKLTVVGNTRLNGDVKVSGEVHANCVRTGCLHVTGETSFDSLRVSNTIRTNKITHLPGDSLIHLGDSSIIIDDFNNSISAVQAYTYGFNHGNLFRSPISTDLKLQDQTTLGTVQYGGNPVTNNTILNPHLGRVGIGTTSPSAKLEVFDVVDGFAGIRINNNSFSNSGNVKSGIDLWNDGNHMGMIFADRSTNNIVIRNVQTASGDIKFQTQNAAVDAMVIRKDGNVGIGTTSPNAKLHIANGSIYVSNPNGFWANGWKNAIETEMGYVWKTTEASNVNSKYYGLGVTNSGWYWITADAAGATQNFKYPMRLEFNDCGKPTLTVAQDVWCDYVFDENHKRPTFEETENDLRKNKHLRGIAPEKEILENGLDITGTMKGLTLNVEEMRLDMIELYKMIQEQKKIIEEQQKEIERLKENQDK